MAWDLVNKFNSLRKHYLHFFFKNVYLSKHCFKHQVSKGKKRIIKFFLHFSLGKKSTRTNNYDEIILDHARKKTKDDSGKVGLWYDEVILQKEI